MTKKRLAGMFGNILDHYDKALFGLLAPFIAPLFFEGADPVTALILTYGMLPLGYLARPFGSLFFGYIGDRFGRQEALSISLLGLALATVSIGLLPTHREIGFFSPLILVAARLLQNFFAAGESSGAAILVLEGTKSSKRELMSGIYDASSIGGILVASALVTLFSDHWRLLFFVGGLTGIVGVLFRMKIVSEEKPVSRVSFKEMLSGQWGTLLSIIFASGFSYSTYTFAFTLMNGYIPLVTSLTKTEVMGVNTALLGIDMILLPIFGLLANRLGKEKVMLFGALGMSLTAIPLFALLESATLWSMIGIRLAILFFGVAFAAPYHAWALERVPPHCRYTILSLGSALGAQLVGAPITAISFWLYQQTGWTVAPGIYLAVVAFIAFFVVTGRQSERTAPN